MDVLLVHVCSAAPLAFHANPVHEVLAALPRFVAFSYGCVEG
jgi:hypothetical protein